MVVLVIYIDLGSLHTLLRGYQTFLQDIRYTRVTKQELLGYQHCARQARYQEI